MIVRLYSTDLGNSNIYAMHFVPGKGVGDSGHHNRTAFQQKITPGFGNETTELINIV